MNIKSLSLHKDNGNFESTSWRDNMFRGPKKREVLQLDGVPLLGRIRYVLYDHLLKVFLFVELHYILKNFKVR